MRRELRCVRVFWWFCGATLKRRRLAGGGWKWGLFGREVKGKLCRELSKWIHFGLGFGLYGVENGGRGVLRIYEK